MPEPIETKGSLHYTFSGNPITYRLHNAHNAPEISSETAEEAGLTTAVGRLGRRDSYMVGDGK